MSNFQEIPDTLENLMGLRSIIIASIEGHESVCRTLRNLEHKHGRVKSEVITVRKHIEQIIREDKQDLDDINKRIAAKQPPLFDSDEPL